MKLEVGLTRSFADLVNRSQPGFRRSAFVAGSAFTQRSRLTIISKRAGEPSIVCFRYIPTALQGDEAGIDRVNRAIVPRIQQEGEAFITSTVLRERFALRACILHDATTQADMQALLEIVRRAGMKALEEK